MVLIEAMDNAQVGALKGSCSAFLIFFVGRGCFFISFLAVDSLQSTLSGERAGLETA